MEGKSGEKIEKTASEDDSEVRESVAYSLIDDLCRARKISAMDADFLRKKYKKMYDVVLDSQLKDKALAKKSRLLSNEILNEKITLEKVRLDESDEIKNQKKLEQIRDSAQKDLEFTEQRDIMSKFELSELKKLHEELSYSLSVVRKDNKAIVEPVLEGLRKELLDLEDQINQSDELNEKEIQHKKNLMIKLEEIESLKLKKEQELTILQDKALKAQLEPNRLVRQSETIEKAANSMNQDLLNIKTKINNIENQIQKQNNRKEDVAKLKQTLEEKLELHRQTIEIRQQEMSVLRLNLEHSKSKNHDLITSKVELNVRKKEADSHLRHTHDQLSLAQKEYEALKRFFKKRRSVADSTKQVVPLLEVQLKNEEIIMQGHRNEVDTSRQKVVEMKDDIDLSIARFLQQEGIEHQKKQELEQVINAVDDLEADVMHLMAEEKRQSKLVTVLSGHRDIKAREGTRIQLKERETRQHVRMKELIVLDLTKRCNEIANRLKEFSALYEVVKNERNKYVNLIQSSSQALAEMREKIRILTNEVEILRNESNAKDKAFNKERTSHSQAQNQRDSLRQEMNKLLAEYRQKQGIVEQQIQEIDKLNLVINSLEQEMLDLKAKYEKSVEERNTIGVQLIDRNDELCILYERCKQQQETLTHGEDELRRKEVELRMLRLQSEELQRQYHAAVTRIPEVEYSRNRLRELEEELKEERKVTDEMSSKLEDPQNGDRWRALEGSDLDPEQLAAKVTILEDRLSAKRELLLEKGLVLEEVTALTNRLQSQAISRRDSAKMMADQLNLLQSKIRDTTKKMLASVSELSMYQATALRLQQEKGYREKKIEAANWNTDHGQAPNEDAIKDWERMERRKMMQAEAAMRYEEQLQLQNPMSMVKSTAYPRPTAYIPDELGLPKPYGNSAPFKPSELGSSMRHIKPPQPRVIEI